MLRLSGNTKQIVRFASGALSALAIGYVLVILIREVDSVAPLVKDMSPLLALGSVLALMLAMFPLGVAVTINLRMLGYRVSLLDACYAFFVSQIGKYVPGKVLLYIIRGGIYSRYGVPIRVIVVSMSIEIALFVASALAISMLLLPIADFDQDFISPLAAVPLALALVVVCSPPVMNRLLAWWHPQDAGTGTDANMGWMHLASMLASYSIAWLAIGAAFMLMIQSVLPVPGQSYAMLTAAFVLACVGGYLLPLAPAGIGVRELVLMGALTTLFTPGTAAALALLARCWWTLAEFGWIGIVLTVRWIVSSGERQMKQKEQTS